MRKGEFKASVKDSLRKRAGEKCSKCYATTAKPKKNESGYTNLGEAAHIKGRNNGPHTRYDASMSNDERASEQNGIWLCKPCHKEIDSNCKYYTVEKLQDLKNTHEKRVEEGFFDQQYPTYELEKTIEHDGEVFKHAKSIVSEKEIIDYFNQINSSGFFGFEDDTYDELQAFYKYHERPEGRYLNEELNKLFKEFRYQAISLISYIIDETQKAPKTLMNLVPPSYMKVGLQSPPEKFGMFDVLHPNYRRRYNRYRKQIDLRVKKIIEAYSKYRLTIKNKLFK